MLIYIFFPICIDGLKLTFSFIAHQRKSLSEKQNLDFQFFSVKLL